MAVSRDETKRHRLQQPIESLGALARDLGELLHAVQSRTLVRYGWPRLGGTQAGRLELGAKSAGRAPGVRALGARTGHSNDTATLPHRLEPSGGLIEK